MFNAPLTELLSQLPPPLRAELNTFGAAPETATVCNLSQDSRLVEENTLFAAIRGSNVNGEDYIDNAVARGASVILSASVPASLSPDICYLAHPHPGQLLSLLSAAFYQPQPTHCVAITGTDGKTSTAEFVRQLYELLTIPALSVGTLGLRSNVVLSDIPVLTENTSPEPATLHQALRQACLQGVTHIACEASSHGLAQHRCDGLHPTVGIFTSFSQDHLDYHASMDAYFAAKARLFKEVMQPDGVSIMCVDYPTIQALAETLRRQGRPVITYGSAPEADLKILAITPTPSGQHVNFNYEGMDYAIHLPIYGDFQVYNMLAALCAVSATTSHHLAEILPHCAALTTIRGRLECVGVTANDARVFVDYAHTPAALEKALTTLRASTNTELHVIFGCGGDRDTGKRPLMGRVACEHADHIVITDDNPRTEEPAAIRNAIHTACPRATVISDRREAITTTLGKLTPHDVLLIAGKGHESYQIIGTTKHHFDDAEIVGDWISEELQRDR